MTQDDSRRHHPAQSHAIACATAASSQWYDAELAMKLARHSFEGWLAAGHEDASSSAMRHSGQSVACADLTATPQQWPRFAVAAREQGFAAVQAVSMKLREQILGALNLFRCAPSAIPSEATAVAQSFANVATISILQLRALRHSEIVTEQLQSALNSRILIEQAKGILAERRHISLSEAFIQMRTYARDHNRLLSQIAQAVITKDPDLIDLAMPPTPPQ